LAKYSLASSIVVRAREEIRGCSRQVRVAPRTFIDADQLSLVDENRRTPRNLGATTIELHNAVFVVVLNSFENRSRSDSDGREATSSRAGY
jgi:hypothetical protein